MVEQDKAFVNRIGNNDTIIPKEDTWKNMVRSVDYFTDDFMLENNPPSAEDKREEF